MKSNYLLCLAASMICFFLLSCAKQNKMVMAGNKTEDELTRNGKKIITAPVVAKNFIKKNGQSASHTEMYIQRSIQDYFIKFCESKITREDLEKHLSGKGFIKTATLEVEFREGSWDICDNNLEQQSRIGEYVVIHRIIED